MKAKIPNDLSKTRYKKTTDDMTRTGGFFFQKEAVGVFLNHVTPVTFTVHLSHVADATHTHTHTQYYLRYSS